MIIVVSVMVVEGRRDSVLDERDASVDGRSAAPG